MTVRTDIEDRYAWVVNTSLLGSSFVLVIGLIVHIVLADEALAQRILRVGLVLLMATPALRILIAVADRARRRDVQFIVITLVVIVELCLTLWYAAARV
jgi:uncharacterized membrane protein